MTLKRTFIIIVAMVITMLFVWQANSPVSARGVAPLCGGNNLLEALKKDEPWAYADLLRRENSILNGKGLLWKIERRGTPTSYLYGTMHMSDERLTTLPGPVADALDEAKTVAVEIGDMIDDKKMQRAIIKNMDLITFKGGRTLDNVLTAIEQKYLKSVLAKYKVPYTTSRIMKPWFVMLSMALTQCEMQRQVAGLKGLDVTIARTGQKNGANIIGLETVREQFTAFAGLPIVDQVEMLMGSVRMNHHLNDQIETMTQLYLQRRTGGLWVYSLYMNKKYAPNNKNAQLREQRAMKNFEQALVVKRNKVMSRRALPLLQKGNLFIAVGALHLPGKSGLVHLLQKAGYKVSVMY